jgi:Tfp pilus assembly PilM family ATPase
MFGVGCEHEPAELIVDAFESAGALVMALDVRACALARAIGAGSASGVTAIVELGWEHARLVATLGGVVLYERLVEEAGLHGAAAEIARALDVDDDVAAFILSGDDAAVELGVMDEAGSIIDSVWSGAVEEVGASLAYAEHRYIDAETGRLVLVGPGAAMDRALAVFGSAVGVDATVCTPSSVATCGDGLGQLASAPSLMAALGFATWEG